MQIKIKHELSRRIQFSTHRYLFSKERAYGLENLLQREAYVESAVVNPITGNITVFFTKGAKDKVVSYIDNLSFGSISLCERENGNIDYWLKREFQDKIIKRVMIRYIMKNFAPAPLGYVNLIRGGLPILKRGLESLKNRKLDVNVLDMTAIAGATLTGDMAAANSIIFYIGISEILEEYTEKNTKLNLGRSLALNVEKVWKVLEDGSEKQVELGTIQVGDVISVYAGTMVPVDGKVVSGVASIDESTMTGESEPVLKDQDASVYAGTVLVEGNIRIEVKALESDTRLSKIVDLIYAGEEKKAESVAKAELLADKIVPYSLSFALMVGLFSRSFIKGVSVLMVDYSCALRLTIPLSIMTAMKDAVDNKVLVRGGKHIEAYKNSTSIVFDKTGTLTKASPRVKKVVALEGYKEEDVIRDVACIEEHFPHSMATAIVKYAEEQGIKHKELHTEVEYVVAHGIVTNLHGKKAMVGSKHFLFEDEGVEFTKELEGSLLENQDTASVIFFALDSKPAGYVLLEDPPRDEAKEVIRKLREVGITDIWMLTGDDEKNAKAVADELGIDDYMAQVLPENKVEKIDEIMAQNKDVIMVGDGINDSPALARASVSVALKDASDLAKEVADIVILDSNLESLLFLRELSENTMKRVQRNYRNIIGFNSILIALGVGGVTTPATNSLLHNLSTFMFGVASTASYLTNLEQR